MNNEACRKALTVDRMQLLECPPEPYSSSENPEQWALICDWQSNEIELYKKYVANGIEYLTEGIIVSIISELNNKHGMGLTEFDIENISEKIHAAQEEKRNE